MKFNVGCEVGDKILYKGCLMRVVEIGSFYDMERKYREPQEFACERDRIVYMAIAERVPAVVVSTFDGDTDIVTHPEDIELLKN